MAIGGNNNENLDLISEQKRLVDFCNVNQADKQTEHQGSRAVQGSLEEAALVNEVLTGDEDEGEKIYGIFIFHVLRQKTPCAYIATIEMSTGSGNVCLYMHAGL